MPKKTRKQKVAAEKRKVDFSKAPKSYSIIDKNQELKPVPTRVEPVKKVFNDSKSPFTKDLYKSILISAAILLFEIGLYIVQLKGISINTFL